MATDPSLSPANLYTASIASGSNGNCYYVGNEEEAVLIDVGISCRELERRMQRIGLSMTKVRAIFISHEHTDHIKGLAVVANKYQLPVFLTEGTLSACRLAIPGRLLYLLRPGYQVHVGKLEVIPFAKLHDAADPQSFVIRQGARTVGVFTDIGAVCDRLAHYFQQCDIAFLETNYDEEMLDKGRYPYYLKKRIKGGYGHLSNHQALELFLQHRSPSLRLLFLCHLSRDNNDPELALDLFGQHAGPTTVVLAGRDAETAVYRWAEKQKVLAQNSEALTEKQEDILHFEEKSVSYVDGHIITYQSCTIRWSVQSV